jgi:hypothetical protein
VRICLLNNVIAGFWITGSGAIYEFYQKRQDVLAVYRKPSEDQKETGVKDGDIAYVGTLVGRIATGGFHHRAHFAQRVEAPASWYYVDPLYLSISEDWTSMEGDLLVPHTNDQGIIDDRRLDHLIFQRQATFDLPQ